MTRWHGNRLGRLWALAVVCAGLLVFAACGGDGSTGSATDGVTAQGETTADGDTNAEQAVTEPLRIASTFEFTSIDPHPGDSYFYADAFGQGELLLRPTPSGEPEPWVLESVEAVSPTEWRLEVKEGVTFQNGKPCDAEAVAALINHHVAENSIVTAVLPGATAEATGPTTVMLTTTSPVSTVPDLLAHYDMFVVFDVEAYETAKAAAGDDAEALTQALIDAGIYTGPYRVTELNSQHFVATRNEDYWQGMPALPGVEVKWIDDAQARQLAVESGEVDISLHPPTEVARSLENSQAAHFVQAEQGTWGPRMYLNIDTPPVDDVLVRQALSAAIDYEAIANEVWDGYYDVATGLFPSHLPFSVKNQVYDPDRARALLDQAGWVDSGDGVRTKNGQPLELTLVTYRTDPDMLPIAVAIRSQLEEVGVPVEIKEIESSSEVYDQSNNDWHAAILTSGFFGFSGDLIGVVNDYFRTDAPWNAGGIVDNEIDALAAELLETFDEEGQHDLLSQLQGIMIAEKAYVIVPAEQRAAAIVSDDWADYEPSLAYEWVDWQTAP